MRKQTVIINTIFLCTVFFVIVDCCAIPCYENIDSTWAEKTLQSLTLRQKIGQLFMVATTSSFEQREEALASKLFACPYRMDHDYIEQLIKEYYIGGVIFLFKSAPEKQIDLTNRLQSMSSVPLLIGQDCEWGLSMRLYNTIEYPRNKFLGALHNTELVYRVGAQIGKQCKAIGVHINFSPVVDINNNPHNIVIGTRSFGDDPLIVTQCGLAMMQGLQDQQVMACAKHFPGHGDTSVDSHFDLPCINHDKKRFFELELVPFKKLIDAGIGGVMSAHLAIPAFEKELTRASSLSYAIVTQLLEKDLCFDGLKITDALGMQAITKQYKPGELELQAFLAGNDILLCPLDVPKAVALIEQAIVSGKISETELDKRVLKILKAKVWTGCYKRDVIDKQSARAVLDSLEAHALKKQLDQVNMNVKKTTHTSPQKLTYKTQRAHAITAEVAKKIGMQIWQNEMNQRVDQLVFWNRQEKFPSLGIGHCIWCPHGQSITYSETFPTLCLYLQQHNIALPDWLAKNIHAGAPWSSREEFIKDTIRVGQLRDMLAATIHLQTQFMIEQLSEQLPLIIAAVAENKRAKIIKIIDGLLSTDRGMYILIDYCNFKGSGLHPKERINNQGWGLLQVLCDSADSLPIDTLYAKDTLSTAFALSAMKLLIMRVQHSSPPYTCMSFVPGWIKRVETYTNKKLW